jgi:ABC-2 type transport system ATP-binding protein
VSTAASPEVAVETTDLRKTYPKVEALSGVSLSIRKGEIFALLGPNGAGKTTWISIVCGLVRATAGRAAVLGHDVVGDSMAARRLVGLVPQEVNFDPFFTPREILAFQMGYYGLRTDAARIDEVLAAMDLTAKADANTRSLSGGMKRRLLIAKALVHKPPVLFLDEPTAGVDVGLRHDLWTYVRTLRAQGTTIVLTTHYLEEAEELADRVGVIDHGTLVSLDRPAELLATHGSKHLRLTLRDALPAGAEELLPTPFATAGLTIDSTRRVLTCRAAAASLPALLAAAAALRPPVVDIQTEQPSLEQVFLKLTGGSRDKAAAATGSRGNSGSTGSTGKKAS